MGQFLPPKGQQLPAAIADVKNRIRRVEHKIEALNGKGSDTGGIEVTFSASIPASAAVGDVWYKTSGDSVIAQYQCVTAYASGAGVQADWTAYTQDGSGITPGTVGGVQLASQAVGADNLADAAVTMAAINTTDVTARTLGGNLVTVGSTEPTTPIDGDTWIETDGSGDVTSIWTRNGTWIESPISITTSGGVQITASTTAPSSPNNGDIWINESNGNVLEQWSASANTWQPYQFGAGSIASGAVDTAQLSSTVAGNISTAQSTANTALSTAQSKAKVNQGSSVPPSASVGDAWIQVNSAGTAITGIFVCTTTYTSGGTTANWSAETLNARTLGAPFIYYQGTTPNTANNASNPPQLNDLWVNSSSGNVTEQMTGGTAAAPVWTQFLIGNGALGAGAVGTANVQNGAITTTQIAKATLGAAPSTIASGNSGSAVLSFSVTATKAVPAGTNIFIGVGGFSTATTMAMAVTDSAGNTYNLVGTPSTTGTNEPVWIFQGVTAAAVTTSTTFTATTDTSQVLNIIAVEVPSSSGYDFYATANDNSTTVSMQAGPFTFAPEYVIAFEHDATNTPAWTSPMSSLTTTSGGGGGFFTAAYSSITTAGAVTVGATQSSATNWTLAVVSTAPTTGIQKSQVSFNAASIGGITTTISATQPLNPNINDLWYNANNSYALTQWDGTNWNPYQFGTAALQANSITSDLLQANSVTAGTVAAGAIDGMTVNAPIINGGQINASNFVVEPGTNNGILMYATPPANTTLILPASTAGSWKCPAGVTSIKVECWAPGGGGAGGVVKSPTAYYGGGGGGGGEYACEPAVTVVPGNSYSYSVGATGAGGTGWSYPTSSNSTAGTAGGNVTFTGASVTVTAHGGKGGLNNTGAGQVAAAAGGTGSTNTIHYNGGAGGIAVTGQGAGGGSSAGSGAAGNAGGDSAHLIAGSGAAAPTGGGYGGGGDGYNNEPTSSNTAQSGFAPGGGGGGGRGTGYTSPVAASYGQSGGNGLIKITYTNSGTPELIGSVSAVTTTDRYSNTVKDGFTTYGPSGSYVQMATNQANSTPYLIFNPPSFAGGGDVWPQIFGATDNAGAANAYYELMIQAGAPASYAGPTIQMLTDARDGSTSGITNIGKSSASGGITNYLGVWQGGIHVQGGAYITGDSPTSPGTQETWHSLSVPSGWSGYIRYKKTAWNTVMVQWEVSGGNATLNWTIATLPVGYRPTTDFKTAAGVYATASSNQIIRCNISTGGALSALGSGLTINEFDGFAEVPLD